MSRKRISPRHASGRVILKLMKAFDTPVILHSALFCVIRSSHIDDRAYNRSRYIELHMLCDATPFSEFYVDEASKTMTWNIAFGTHHNIFSSALSLQIPLTCQLLFSAMHHFSRCRARCPMHSCAERLQMTVLPTRKSRFPVILQDEVT